MSQRGPYAKGVAKREEILGRALEIVARQGYRGASVQVIADAVGLSQAGLLHYFGSKEELFTAILRKRDELDHLSRAAPSDPRDARDAFVQVIAHNSEVPGLVELFSRLAVEAADPEHPAHAYFLERGEVLRETIVATLAQLRRPPALPPETLARIVQAAADGLQLQWLLDPTVDMAATMEALLNALAQEGHP
ncbi:TetR/AcrR family transcriptional regulator [Streptosporangium minutum]|uniref:TetR family transcriptional regulator n=1 Tax=Streptosporangium minutum TaxID=569862 RepID=A0A243RP16_9ACTN|nr:TetR/AcrR family transcriptional regulator [Streptosporangium minutum]OUC96736.1 TetR family transcriptional regulator [Streptosporangium minutum]